MKSVATHTQTTVIKDVTQSKPDTLSDEDGIMETKLNMNCTRFVFTPITKKQIYETIIVMDRVHILISDFGFFTSKYTVIKRTSKKEIHIAIEYWTESILKYGKKDRNIPIVTSTSPPKMPYLRSVVCDCFICNPPNICYNPI